MANAKDQGHEKILMQKIVNYPKDTAKFNALQHSMALPTYTTTHYFRDQLNYLYHTCNQFLKDSSKDKTFTQEDLAYIFDRKLCNIKYHMGRANKEQSGDIKQNGRPFILNQSQISQVKDYVDSQDIPPHDYQVSDWCFEQFKILLTRKQLLNLAEKIGYTIVSADPIEDVRYEVKESDIDAFYNEVEAYTTQNSIPSAFAINIDEEGYDDYSCAKKKNIFIKQTEYKSGQKYFYPVSRREHTTFLAAINAYGDSFRPLITTKRATIELELLQRNIGPDKVLLKTSPKGYVIKDIFQFWVEEEFVPRIKQLRTKYNYDGPGLILIDGCSSHFSEKFFELCNSVNMKVFFLPAHSSNQTQPLDLGVFHLHKAQIRKQVFEDDPEGGSTSHFVKTVELLINTWEKVSTTSVVMGAWKAMGAEFVIHSISCTKVIIRKSNALKLMNHEKSKAERKQMNDDIWNTWKPVFSKRVPVDTFNKLLKGGNETQVLKEVDKLKIAKEFAPTNGSITCRLLNAMVPCELVVNNILQDNPTVWKPKGNDEKAWRNMPISSRYSYELASLQLAQPYNE